jgi:hypothetical protein
MGKKSVLVLVLFVLIFERCECPKKIDSFLALSSSQKEWFVQGLRQDTALYMFSDNGLTDIIHCTFDNDLNGNNQSSAKEGKCPTYQGYESYAVNYYSLLSGSSWRFQLSTQSGSNEFSGSFDMNSGNYSSCYFTLSLDSLKLVKKLYYYPNKIDQREGLIYVGDSILNNKMYHDIYRMDLALTSNANPLEIRKFVLSKKNGLLAYQTFNNVNWMFSN